MVPERSLPSLAFLGLYDAPRAPPPPQRPCRLGTQTQRTQKEGVREQGGMGWANQGSRGGTGGRQAGEAGGHLLTRLGPQLAACKEANGHGFDLHELVAQDVVCL